MGGGPYLVVLLIGVIIVVLDGQLILRNSPGYLAGVFGPRPANRLALLVAVFFHLVMFGVVALVASLGLGPTPDARALIARIGVILLLTAVGHAITMVILSRMRQEQESSELAELAAEHSGARRGAAGEPAPGAPAPRRARDTVAPPVEQPVDQPTEQPVDQPTGRAVEPADEPADEDQDAGPAERSDRPKAHYSAAAEAGDGEIRTGDTPQPPDWQPATTRSTDPQEPRSRRPR